MEKQINIIVADDELLFRKGIVFLLNSEEDIRVLFEAGDGKELLEYLQLHVQQPDIILIDLNMPEVNGVEATKTIRKLYPEIKIIALTSYYTPMFVANMIHEGAASYLSKNASPHEMIYTINQVAEKGFYYNDYVLGIIKDNTILANRDNHSLLSGEFLSTREIEILELICRQNSTAEISTKLCLSPRTVDGYRKQLLFKTSSKNVAGLVVFAIQHNMISPEFPNDNTLF